MYKSQIFDKGHGTHTNEEGMYYSINYIGIFIQLLGK